MEEPQHSATQTYLPSDEYRPEPVARPLLPPWMDGSVRIGIHTSIAGDITKALDIAARLGANALQIFSASPQMWSRSPGGGRIGDEDARRFRARREELKLGPLVIHDNYLINLASPERVLRTRSIQAFHEEIVRALALGADFLVAHPGSGRGAERSAAIAAIADGLKQAARGVNFAGNSAASTQAGGLRILLENTAGQGSSVGARFEELAEIIAQCPEVPLGVCVDTAHLLASGHDVRSAAGLEAVFAEIDRTVGMERVFVVHVNDSKAALGSRIDRHEHIGKGKIGLAAFRRILNHPMLTGRAFILETPIDRPGDDRRNVEALWKLVGMKARESKSAADGFRMKRTRVKNKKSARSIDKSKIKTRFLTTIRQKRTTRYRTTTKRLAGKSKRKRR